MILGINLKKKLSKVFFLLTVVNVFLYYRWDSYDKKLDDEWHVLMMTIFVSVPVVLG